MGTWQDMKQYLFDTNAFLRYVLHDNPHQSDEIATLFAQAKKHECDITLPLVVFFEATYVLVSFYQLSKKDVVAQLKRFLQISYIHIPDRIVLQKGYVLWSQQGSISFADAVLLEMAKFEGRELVTFDKKLKHLSLQKIAP